MLSHSVRLDLLMSVSPLNTSVVKDVASWQHYEVGNIYPTLFFRQTIEKADRQN